MSNKQQATLAQRQVSYDEIRASLAEFNVEQPELQEFFKTLESYKCDGREANGVCLLPLDGVKLIYDLVNSPSRHSPARASCIVVVQSIVSIKKSQDLLKAVTSKSSSEAGCS